MRSRLRRAAAGLAALLLVLVCTPIAPAQARTDRYGDIDAFVRDRMEDAGVPGLSYAVVGPGGPLHQRWWGTDGRGDRVTARTPFLWGSVAKPVTGTAVMALVEAGRLGLDDRVTEHLPGFRFGGAAHASKVTVRHLLNQTSGLPASATFEVADCLDADCPRPAGRLRALDGVEPLGPPGTAYAYTSANYLVLTAVVEAVTGRRYADHLREAVLAPAGMDGAIADAASARERRLAPGHRLLWGLPAATAGGFDDSGAGYGYLGGDLGDLAAFAAFQLRGAPGVLSPGSVRLMRREGTLQPTGAGTGYGLGWRVGGLDAPLDRAVWHTGGTPGYSAMVFLLPERNLALVLQQNLYGLLQDGAVMHIGFGAARMLAGGRPGPAPSAAPYYLAVGTATALAAALILAAGRSAWLLRRPASTATGLRGTAATGAWILAGALPWIAAVPLMRMGLRQVWTWVPDATAALGAAATAGAATAVLRLVLALRSRRSRTR
ncbi:beta-lactamase family protein [Actinomadura sp. NAK00032]|uniref:serine hydrolase domain-containing protein n=1 Tax=Actinomadura sp. NAK00032 TaxID=2742128 RepID=UPI0015915C31|nr:serine hydrolase domain-containing protein [Actinomadura sp. NAK00032]QKW36819.1 beta-lactamase family protein [Actinomadura sp. NAK00032]